MEKGSIKFIYEDGKTPSLEIELANGNLWMTKGDIARLFNCFVQKIDANIRSIFKEKLLWEDDVLQTRRYTNSAGLECQTELYSLEMLMFLSYRINTLETKIFRQEVNSALQGHLRKDKMPKQRMKIVWGYLPTINYCLN